MTKSRPPRRHLRTKRRALVAVAGGIAAVGLVLGGGVAANAALNVTVINTDGMGVASRPGPHLSPTNGYGAPADAQVSAICWVWGDAVGPHANTLWWKISYAGRVFYASDRYLSTPYIAGQTPTEPNCDSQSQSPSGQPHANPDANAWYTLTAQNSGLDVDVHGGSAANGTAVQQYQSNGTKSQQWRFVPTDGGYYKLVSALTGRPVLDVAGGGTGNFTKVQTWQYAGGANQQWAAFDDGNGYITLKPRHVGSRCLDVPGGSRTAGVQLQIWDCNGTASQQFHLTSVRSVGLSQAAQAVAWAAAQDSQPTAIPADAALYTDSEWWPGDRGEWSGDCVKYVWIAWHHAGRTIMTSADAAAMYAAYVARNGGPLPTGPAPAGALVFWPNAALLNGHYYGHVALSDGNGGVYSTVGHDGQGISNGHRSIADISAHNALGWASGAPAGWAMP